MTPFQKLQNEITDIGVEWHSKTIIENSKANAPYGKSIRDISPHGTSCLIVSAGPSLYRNKILEKIRGYQGLIVAIDGSFIRCLNAKIWPSYVLTLDPHPTRVVRWFGDPHFEEGDPYWSRQDLDPAFRQNQKVENWNNLDIVNRRSSRQSLVISSTSPKSVVSRVKSVGMNLYWFTPLVDDPEKDGLTKEMIEITGLPAMNTGGCVGTAAWVFAHTVLKIKNIAVVGMDFGYHKSTPIEQTQTWPQLKDRPDVGELFPRMGEWYTDPTYYWYRQNLLDLVEASGTTLINCTGGGTLVGDNIKVMDIEEWLKSCW